MSAHLPKKATAMAQRPILLTDAQLDPVLTAFKTFLSDKTIQETIRQARNLGGWEGWLQVQFAFFLKAYLTQYDTEREGQVFTNNRQHVDLWSWTLPTAPQPQPPPFFIELKIQYTKQKPQLRDSLPERLKADIDKFYDGTRTFKPQYTNGPAPRGTVYCIGYTSDQSECTEGYDTLFAKYPGFQMFYWRMEADNVGRMQGDKPQHLVWWKRDL